MNQPQAHMCSHPEPTSHLPPHPIAQGHPCAPALSTLSHASNLDQRSTSCMIIYTFQRYPLKSSHPHLLPQSPKDCSLHLCLFFCLTYRVIVNHLSKFHIYVLVLAFFFLKKLIYFNWRLITLQYCGGFATH